MVYSAWVAMGSWRFALAGRMLALSLWWKILGVGILVVVPIAWGLGTSVVFRRLQHWREEGKTRREKAQQRAAHDLGDEIGDEA